MKASEFCGGSFITNGEQIYRIGHDCVARNSSPRRIGIESIDGDDWQLLTPAKNLSLGRRVELKDLEANEQYAVQTVDGWRYGSIWGDAALRWPDSNLPAGYGSSNIDSELARIIAIHELGDYKLPDNPVVPVVEKSLREKLFEVVGDYHRVDRIAALLESEAKNE